MTGYSLRSVDRHSPAPAPALPHGVRNVGASPRARLLPRAANPLNVEGRIAGSSERAGLPRNDHRRPAAISTAA